MKKKLFEEEKIYLSIVILAMIGLFAGIISAFRGLTFPKVTSKVSVRIPVLIEEFKDPAYHNFILTTPFKISNNTVAIVMDAKGNFYFGDLAAFSTDFHLATNKFVVYQQEGSPQVGELLYQLELWLKQREQKQYVFNDGLAIFVPSVAVPMSIVILVLRELNKSNIFQHVILGTGLL